MIHFPSFLARARFVRSIPKPRQRVVSVSGSTHDWKGRHLMGRMFTPVTEMPRLPAPNLARLQWAFRIEGYTDRVSTAMPKVGVNAHYEYKS